LAPEATAAKFASVQKEGQRTVSREIDFYNLDAFGETPKAAGEDARAPQSD
jgi:hypothetical protein